MVDTKNNVIFIISTFWVKFLQFFLLACIVITPTNYLLKCVPKIITPLRLRMKWIYGEIFWRWLLIIHTLSEINKNLVSRIKVYLYKEIVNLHIPYTWKYWWRFFFILAVWQFWIPMVKSKSLINSQMCMCNPNIFQKASEV